MIFPADFEYIYLEQLQPI